MFTKHKKVGRVDVYKRTTNWNAVLAVGGVVVLIFLIAAKGG